MVECLSSILEALGSILNVPAKLQIIQKDAIYAKSLGIYICLNGIKTCNGNDKHQIQKSSLFLRKGQKGLEGFTGGSVFCTVLGLTQNNTVSNT